MQLSNLSALRRALTATAACTLVVTLGLASPLAAEESSPEQDHVQIVNDFMAAWSDPDKAVTFLAPNASVRMVEDQPAVVGHEAIAAAFKSFMTPGVTLEVETLESIATGPIVINKRVDTMKTEGKPDQVFPVVGVFVVRDGKITEWTDYLDK